MGSLNKATYLLTYLLTYDSKMIDSTQTDPLGKRSLYRRSAVRVSAGTQILHYINAPRSARGYAGDTGDQSVLTTLYLVNGYRRPPAHARQCHCVHALVH